MPIPAEESDEFIQGIEFVRESARKKEKIRNQEEGQAGYFLPISGRGWSGSPISFWGPIQDFPNIGLQGFDGEQLLEKRSLIMTRLGRVEYTKKKLCVKGTLAQDLGFVCGPF
jgi:hypothetical protein